MKVCRVKAPSPLIPKTPSEALLLAEAHLRVIGFVKENPQLSPLAIVLNQGMEVNAGVWPTTKLRVKELLPGLKLRTGNSQIEIVRVLPATKEVVYKNQKGKLFQINSEDFIKLANQQGYRRVWSMNTFLGTLKDLLKPVLSAVPLMWVLKLVVDSVRKKPMKFATSLPHETVKLDTGKKVG